MIKLIGILIIAVGFAIGFDTIAVVILAGIVTGLVGGIEFMDLLALLGDAFVGNRYMTMFLMSLAVIGIMERYGLQQTSTKLIGKIKGASGGKVLMTYMGVRTLAAALSLRLGGHIQFIRPLVYPMSKAATNKDVGELDEHSVDVLKGFACAVENYGNFYGQNVFVAAGGVLLIVGTLKELGIEVAPLKVALASIPIALIAVVYAVIHLMLMDRKMRALSEGSKQSTEMEIKEDVR